MRESIRSCLMELYSYLDGEYNNYILYSSIEDKDIIEKRIQKILDTCKNKDDIDLKRFEDLIDEEEYFTIYPVTNFTSCVYSYHNGNINAGHTVQSYGEIDFNKVLHVDLDNSVENGDIIKLMVTDGYISILFTLKDFDYHMDPEYLVLGHALTNLEILSLMVLKISKLFSTKNDHMSVIPYIAAYLEYYCKEVKFSI